MSEMTERVARAIAPMTADWRAYRKEAEAAIKAMREPTSSMALAAELATEVDAFTCQVAWAAMIDEALK